MKVLRQVCTRPAPGVQHRLLPFLSLLLRDMAGSWRSTWRWNGTPDERCIGRSASHNGISWVIFQNRARPPIQCRESGGVVLGENNRDWVTFSGIQICDAGLTSNGQRQRERGGKEIWVDLGEANMCLRRHPSCKEPKGDVGSSGFIDVAFAISFSLLFPSPRPIGK